MLTPGAFAATSTVHAGESIQAAINAAGAGDTINVQSGTYKENLVVNKALTLTGVDIGGGMPIVDGFGHTAITITANGVILRGFNATNATNNYGIAIGSNNTLVTGNVVNNNGVGIYIDDYSYNNVTGNTANNNTNCGIELQKSSYNNITGNIVDYNTILAGIFLDGASYNSLTGNTINDNGYGIYAIWASNNNNITGNTVNRDVDGVVLDGSNNNNVADNKVEQNDQTGISMSDNATGNVLWLNTIGGNNVNAWCGSPETNDWNSTIKLPYTYNGVAYQNYAGNYWGAYTGPDANGDGIGDTPYTIAVSNIDYYPMLQSTSGAPATPEAQGWKFRSYLNNTGVYDDGGSHPGNSLLWNYTTGDGVDCSPTVANGVVYIGGWNGKVYALDAVTGAMKWNYTTGRCVDSAPAVVNGVVYVGSFDRSVYALDAGTGAKKWNFSTGDCVMSSPAVVAGVVYVGSNDHNVYALDAATGAKLWNFSTGGIVASSPAVVAGVVYVGSRDHNVYALDAATGSKLWNYTTGGEVDSSPAVVAGVVYVGSNYPDGKVYALDAATGVKKWSYIGNSLSKSVCSSPAVANGVVYFGSDDRNVYALYANNGSMMWSYGTGDYVGSSPAVANGIVYIGGYDHNVYALDAGTGALLWSYGTMDAVYSSPAVADGVVYVGSEGLDKRVYAIGQPRSQPVTPPLIASLTMNVSKGTAPLSIRFTDLSSGGPTSWEWNFGDGSANATSQYPSHTFTSSGFYTVTLTVRNSTTGAVSSVSRNVMVMGSFPLALKQGWNIVSEPLLLDSNNSSVGTFFGPVLNKILIVWKYDAASGSWQSYVPGAKGNDLTTIDEKSGYLVLANGDACFNVTGLAPSTETLHLYSGNGGWNLIGRPSLDNRSTSVEFNGIAGEYNIVWGYDRYAQAWRSYVPGSSGNDLSSISPGEGYLVMMNKNADYTVG